MTILSHKQIVEIEGEKWKPMSRAEVEKAIADEPSNSHIKHYHSRQDYYEWELDKYRFLSIISLDSEKLTGFLTHGHDLRTIPDVSQRMVDGGHTFKSLVKSHDLEWYKECHKIESDGFDYAKFGTIWLREANYQERTKSPPGKYHIEHGVHRSLVLGKRLVEGKEYKPIRAILIKSFKICH